MGYPSHSGQQGLAEDCSSLQMSDWAKGTSDPLTSCYFLYRTSGKSSSSLHLTISNLLVLVSSVVFLLFYCPCPGIQHILNTHVQDRLITTHVQCRSLSPKDSQANEDCSLWKESEFSLIRNTRQCPKKPSPWTKGRSWSISLKNFPLSMYISWKQLQFLIVKFCYQALLCL